MVAKPDDVVPESDGLTAGRLIRKCISALKAVAEPPHDKGTILATNSCPILHARKGTIWRVVEIVRQRCTKPTRISRFKLAQESYALGLRWVQEVFNFKIWQPRYLAVRRLCWGLSICGTAFSRCLISKKFFGLPEEGITDLTASSSSAAMILNWASWRLPLSACAPSRRLTYWLHLAHANRDSWRLPFKTLPLNASWFLTWPAFLLIENLIVHEEVEG